MWRKPFLLILVFASVPRDACADGGTLRISRQVNEYRVTLFTSPTELHAGPVDFSVLVQMTNSNVARVDLSVAVQVWPVDHPERRLGGIATRDAATNKLFQAITLELSEPGRWQVEVVINNSAKVQTDVEIMPAHPGWLELAPWVAWPGLAIFLFATHCCLVRRRARLRTVDPEIA